MLFSSRFGRQLEVPAVSHIRLAVQGVPLPDCQSVLHNGLAREALPPVSSGGLRDHRGIRSAYVCGLWPPSNTLVKLVSLFKLVKIAGLLITIIF